MALGLWVNSRDPFGAPAVVAAIVRLRLATFGLLVEQRGHFFWRALLAE